MRTLAHRIKAWREGAGLSQEEAARALLISLSAYQKYERGARNPAGITLERINRLLAGAA